MQEVFSIHSGMIPNSPFGGRLVDLYVSANERGELQHYAATLPKIKLTARNTCDLELLGNGAFSPLDRFLGEKDYLTVVEDMRLSNGTLFPIPVTLAVDSQAGIRLDSDIALVDQYNDLLALMTVEEIYEWDPGRESRAVYGTTDKHHCMVSEMDSWGKLKVSGPIRVLQSPRHRDFNGLRLSPRQVREQLASMGATAVVAFQTRNPLHRAHQELTKRAIDQVDGTLLLHPVVGLTNPGDIDHYTRVRSYKVLVEKYYDRRRTLLALLPLAMRMAGPREALWHALIRRNFGATHFIVGRDHASPGCDASGKPFYAPYAAQELMVEHSQEIGVQVLRFSELVYLPDENRYEEADRVPPSTRSWSISGATVRGSLESGEDLPEWIIQPEIRAILAQAYRPRNQQGFCVWFTGLSCAGKSTTAEVLTAKLMECGRQVTLLDGDVVRNNLSPGLGFSRDDRDTNIRRIGFVAGEITRHGGAVICAAVSPFRATRDECRALIGHDHFIEVFVDTPLEVCEQRDDKGMYALAREGKIKAFTGVDDPYEPPSEPEIALNTVFRSAEQNAATILDYLTKKGFLQTEIPSEE